MGAGDRDGVGEGGGEGEEGGLMFFGCTEYCKCLFVFFVFV